MLRSITFSLLLCFGFVQAQVGSDTSRYDQVYRLIRDKYMYQVNVDSIVAEMVQVYLNDTATIKALLHKLDPYSHFYDAAEYAAFKTDMSGTFGGVGLSLSVIDDRVYIAQVFDGTPAQKAGLKPGERIAEIGGFNCHADGLDIWEVIQKLRGDIGTSVEVTIVDAQGKTRREKMVRENIYINSVSAAFMVNKSTGYIKLDMFTDSSGAEVHKALDALRSSGMRQVILDLRDNPGGFMREARKIADEFLPDKALIVYTEGRTGREDYLATDAGIFEKGNVVVLVNAFSASSAEILTGALQGNKRATIIGNRTFGKGLVQRMYVIGDSTEAVKLTTDKYYTPLGVCIQQPYAGDKYVFERLNERITATATQTTSAISDTLPEWGITPDIFVETDTSAWRTVTHMLNDREYIAHAALLYYMETPASLSAFSDPEQFMQKFSVSDAFIPFLAEKVAAWESEYADEPNRRQIPAAAISEEASSIKTAAKSYVAQMIFGQNGFYRVTVPDDPAVRVALSAMDKK